MAVVRSSDGKDPALVVDDGAGDAHGVAAAGLPTLNFHDLKHTAGSALLDEGINVKIAQTRLGHANARTTLAVYAQATIQGERDASDGLGERFRRGMDAG